MKKFPKIIYVERCDEGTRDEYLMIHDHYKDAAVADEATTLAVYELTEIRKVVAKSELI